MPAKKASTQKIVDVAHPDSVKADPTSVPIIVKHGPILKDPMMAEQQPAEKPESKKEENSPAVTKIELKPVSADGKDVKSDKMEDKPVDSEASKPELKPEPTPEPKAEAKPKPPVEPDPEETSSEDPKDAAVDDEAAPETKGEPEDTSEEEPTDNEELLPGTKPTDPAAAKAAREAEERQLALDKLTAEGTYFLQITTAEKRKARTFLVSLLVIIVLGAAGLLAAMDAGYVHIDGFSAPTDFIKN